MSTVPNPVADEVAKSLNVKQLNLHSSLILIVNKKFWQVALQINLHQ